MANTAISNYADLVDAVQIFANTNDDDTLANIPRFIGLAEKEIANSLFAPCMEVTSQLQVDDTGNFISVPSRMLKIIALLDAENDRSYAQIGYDQLLRFRKDGYAFEPVFARMGNYFHLLPAQPKQQIIAHYYVDPPRLGQDAQTHELFQIAPALYLYTTLKHLAVFQRDGDQVQYWQSIVAETAQQAQNAIDAAKWGDTISYVRD